MGRGSDIRQIVGGVALAAAVAAGLSGCQTTQASVPLSQSPEALGFEACVEREAQAAITQSGETIDLAFAAVTACREQGAALSRVVAGVNGKAYAENYMHQKRRDMTMRAKEIIAQGRASG